MKWNVPFIGLPLQFKNQENELTEEFKRVMEEGSFILRNDVTKFEENMASYLNVKHVIGVNSGTDALFLALEASGIGEGDEVITVSHTCIPTLSSIIHNRAKPILVDIKEDFNIDADKIEEAITEKTKAIIPVHLNGRTCEMDKLIKIAEKHNLIIIEDAAQATGSAYKGKKAGTFGIIGCFSAHPLKVLSCAGDGGYISTDNDEIAEKLRILRDIGRKTKTELAAFGYNSRLDNLQAAILNVKFKFLDSWIDKRRQIASIYSEKLADLPLILPPSPNEGDFFDTYNSYVIRTQHQQELFDFLIGKGIEVFAIFKDPLHTQEQLGLSANLPANNKNLPVNEKIAKEILSLPIYPELTTEQIDYVVETLHEFFRNKH